jgi:unsaturated chondroitin disaccharide hydrolase
LEFFSTLEDAEIQEVSDPSTFAIRAWARRQKQPKQFVAYLTKQLSESGRRLLDSLCRAAFATADFYLANSCRDGIPMWDTGAPNLHRLPASYLNKPSDPFNKWEPVDSSAAAIAAQGLIRLGNYLTAKGDTKNGKRYRQAGLTVASTLFSEPYLSTDPRHQGLILHSVYHRPNGWDHIAPGQKVPNGESSMWGDYHARELALMILREARGEPYLTFFGCVPQTS